MVSSQWHADTGTTAETATLRFTDAQGFEAFTVEFQVRYTGQRAFGTELEFGAGQLRLLRTRADRWAGR